MLPDLQSAFLSSGCFLDALINGQLGPTVWSFSVLPEHELFTLELPLKVELQRPYPIFSENENQLITDAPRGSRDI